MQGEEGFEAEGEEESEDDIKHDEESEEEDIDHDNYKGIYFGEEPG